MMSFTSTNAHGLLLMPSINVFVYDLGRLLKCERVCGDIGILSQGIDK